MTDEQRSTWNSMTYAELEAEVNSIYAEIQERRADQKFVHDLMESKYVAPPGKGNIKAQVIGLIGDGSNG